MEVRPSKLPKPLQTYRILELVFCASEQSQFTTLYMRCWHKGRGWNIRGGSSQASTTSHSRHVLCHTSQCQCGLGVQVEMIRTTLDALDVHCFMLDIKFRMDPIESSDVTLSRPLSLARRLMALSIVGGVASTSSTGLGRKSVKQVPSSRTRSFAVPYKTRPYLHWVRGHV